MLRSERNHDRIIGGRSLQLEVERSAKTFSQGQPPGAIDPIAKWRMQDELHSARLVKETFHHQSLLRRNCAERAISVREVIGDLFSPVLWQLNLAFKPLTEILSGVAGICRNIGLWPVRPADILSAAGFSGFQTHWAHRAKLYVPSQQLFDFDSQIGYGL